MITADQYGDTSMGYKKLSRLMGFVVQAAQPDRAI